jgi:hypothetical protein
LNHRKSSERTSKRISKRNEHSQVTNKQTFKVRFQKQIEIENKIGRFAFSPDDAERLREEKPQTTSNFNLKGIGNKNFYCFI